MTENNKNGKIESKQNNNRSSPTSKKMKTKELIEENNNAGSKIGEHIGDLLNVDQSAVLKRSRRIKARRDAAKMKNDGDIDEDNCFRSQYYNSQKFSSFVSLDVDSDSDQFFTPKGDSDVADLNLTPTPGCRTVENESYSQDRQKRIKNISPRCSQKKHVRKLDFSIPIEILNRHAFLLWFSEQYHAYSRQYPNETVDELQDRKKSYWDQLDHRKKAPFFQRARDASCMQYINSVDPGTPEIPAGLRVESRPRGKPKYETPMDSALGVDIWKQFNVTYEFDQLVKDLIWERPVHFESNVKSETLSQIFKDLAELETSGKLTCTLR